jgi:hypothetical protein
LRSCGCARGSVCHPDAFGLCRGAGLVAVRRVPSDDERLALLRRLQAAHLDAERVIEDVAVMYVRMGVPVADVADALGISVATWYRNRKREL